MLAVARGLTHVGAETIMNLTQEELDRLLREVFSQRRREQLRKKGGGDLYLLLSRYKEGRLTEEHKQLVDELLAKIPELKEWLEGET